MSNMREVNTANTINVETSTQEDETPRVSTTLNTLLLMPKLLKFAEVIEKLDLKHTNTYSALLASMHCTAA